MALEDGTNASLMAEATINQQAIAGIKIKTYLPTTAKEDPPIGAVIVTHGYSEHSGRYDSLARAIVACNWACVTYDVRGHGDSDGMRGYIDTFSHYVKDLANVQKVAEGVATKTGNLVFFGHSNGGLITLRYLCEPQYGHNEKIKAAILAAPFLSVATPLTTVQSVLVRMFASIHPQMQNPFEPGFETRLSHDPEMHRIRREDAKCFNHSTMGWFYQAKRAQRGVLRNLTKLKVPTYWFIAGQDLVCAPSVMVKTAEKLKQLGKTAEVYEYPDCFHEIFFETIRDKPTKELQTILARL